MKEILMGSILFKDFTEEEIYRVKKESHMDKLIFAKESYIFNQGETPEFLFILLKGKVQVEKIDINGKRIIVNIFKDKGTVFGEVYLYINKPYDYSCLVLEEAEIIRVPKIFFTGENESKLQKKLTKNMLEVLAEKAFYLNQKLLILGSFTLRQKVANYLIQRLKNSNKVKLQFNREELADYVGTTRPSLSRELMSMEEDGLIQVKKEVIIVKDMDKLVEIS